MKRSFRGYCAALLSLAMVASTVQPAFARNVYDNDVKEATLDKASPSNLNKSEDTNNAGVSTSSEIKSNSKTIVIDPNKDSDDASKSELVKNNSKANYIIYNLGDKEVAVYEDDDEEYHFDEDGSFEIEIPDDNPYFPYEVQFKNDNYTTEKWFMSPDDTVRFAGHEFTLSVDDLSNYSSFELEVGGESVPIYPEEKTFTNKNGLLRKANMLFTSLARVVDTRTYVNGGTKNVDLTGYTPVELTRVKLAGIFAGDELNGKKVMWTRDSDSDDEFTISSPDDYFDLSQSTCSYNQVSWKMVVGDVDQLATGTKYNVNVKVTKSEDWLKVKGVYVDDDGNVLAENLKVTNSSYYDYKNNNTIFRRLNGTIDASEYDTRSKSYSPRHFLGGFTVNEEIFSSPKYDSLKIYNGKYTDESQLSGAEDVTELVESGRYLPYSGRTTTLTLVTEKDGDITGFMPMNFHFYRQGIHVNYSLFTQNGEEIHDYDYEYDDEDEERLVYEVTEPNEKHYLKAELIYGDTADNSRVTAVYLGDYKTTADAKNANAENIKDTIIGDGYLADFSGGVAISIFVGEGDNERVYHEKIYTIKKESGSVYVQFTGLRGKDGNSIPCYFVKETADSYGEFNFPTIIVDDGVDLSEVAPEFTLGDGVTLYAKGSSTPEKSGKSYHNLSSGVIQYTSASEDSNYQCNYWLQVVKPTTDKNLFINSLIDSNAKTERKNGTIYTTREVLLDSFHEDRHDIVLLNMGKEKIEGISVELESNTLELDDYWTLTGESDLLGYSYKESNYTEHQRTLDVRPVNFADIRLNRKASVEDGTDVDGKLTIKSGSEILAVITLTGTIGDPVIITDSIPDAVKYVPYGTMIQNSNKYSWNRPVYSLYDGELPEGMELRNNGELYGVPKVVGDFDFTVKMKNDSKRSMVRSFSDYSDTRHYVFHVADNTDENVEGATDVSYELRPDTDADKYNGRVPDFSMTNHDETYTLISNGAYDEFKYIFLDGEKLTPGDDYSSESGSTRITIKSQTLKKNGKGTHTLGVEFRDAKKLDTSNTSKTRTSDEGTLKRAAQNYHINDNGSSGSSSSSSSGGSSSSSSDGSSTTMYGPENTLQVVTSGHWAQLENGDWTFKDNAGNVQTGWKYINTSGSGPRWFHFNDDGTMSTGWVYSKTGKWYYMEPEGTSEGAMKTGWILDPDDNHWYYIDSKTGSLATGWRSITGFDYYFNEYSGGENGSSGWRYDETAKKWKYEFKSKSTSTWPLGAMLKDCVTPDGFTVDADGKKVK